MAKKNKKEKVVNEMNNEEKELFKVDEIEKVDEVETSNEITPDSLEKEMEEIDLNEDIEFVENDEDFSNEMELELDDESLNEMEEIVAEKVKEEEYKSKKEKSKPGPKGPRDKKESTEKTKKEKTAVEIKSNLEKLIKKGVIAAPQGRIEKMEDGNYRMLLAEAVGTREDVGPHSEWTHVDDVKVMHHGKFILTEYAADKFGFPFKHQTDDGEIIEHKFVRVELHKPGRDKDVVELYLVDDAKRRVKELTKKEIRKEEAKIEKETKENDEVESA